MYVSLKCKLDSNEILNNLADIYIYIYKQWTDNNFTI